MSQLSMEMASKDLKGVTSAVHTRSEESNPLWLSQPRYLPLYRSRQLSSMVAKAQIDDNLAMF